MNILFFDTETTGLPRNWNASVDDLENWPRLVQLAWQVYNSSGNLLEEHEYVIKPVGFIIPSEASAVHKITTEKALENGVDLFTILKVFTSSIKACGLLVAHNFRYDYNIMGSELLRNGLENSLSGKEHICTMNISTDFCKIVGPYGYKWPKLEELHTILFSETFNAHDALDDIKATARCFWELELRGIISVPKSNENINSSRIDLPEKSKNIFKTCYELTKKITDLQTRGVLFENISKTLINLGQTEEAIRIISEITIDYTEGYISAPDKYISKSNSYSYASLILMKRGEIDYAVNLANQITDLKTKNYTLFNIVNIFLERGELKKGLPLISQITDSYYYRNISKILFQKFNFDEALKLISSIQLDWERYITYRDLTEILLNEEKIDDALKIVDLITDESGKNHAYENFAKISIDRGNKEEALKYVSKITDIYKKESCLGKIINMLTKAGRIDEALDVNNEINANSNYAYYRIEIAKKLTQNGLNIRALDILSKVPADKQKCFNESHVSFNTAYKHISEILFNKGNLLDALNIVEMITDDKEKDYAYEMFSNISINKGNIVKALKYVSKIKTSRIKDSAFKHILVLLIQRSQKQEAFELVHEINEVKVKDDVYAYFSKSLMEQGEIEIALKTANKISDQWTKNRTYSDISFIFLGLGKKDEAMEIASKITDYIESSEDYMYHKNLAHYRVSEFLLRELEFEEAIKVFYKMSPSFRRGNSGDVVYSKHGLQTKIITSLIQHNKLNEAFKIATYGFDLVHFESFIKVLTEHGMSEKAFKFIEDFSSMKNEYNSHSISKYFNWNVYEKKLKDTSFLIIAQSLLKSIDYKI